MGDLRNRTSTAVVIADVNDPATCAAKIPPEAAPCPVTAQGTTLEQPPGQSNGSAYNSSMSAGTVTLATPILPGGSVNVQLLFGIQQMGNYRAYVHIEALTEPEVARANGGGGPEGGETVNRKKSQHTASPANSAEPSGPSTPQTPLAAPAATRRPVDGWLVLPDSFRTAPAAPSAEGVETDGDENENPEKKSENAPATSERPAPPPSPAAAEEPGAGPAPAAAPSHATTARPSTVVAPAAPTAAAPPPATRNETSTPKAEQRRAGRRTGARVPRKRAALKRHS